MLEKLQKSAPLISILLLTTLVVALFISRPSARLLSTIIIVFGIGTALLFTVHSNWEKHKENKLTRPEFIRNTLIDLLGLALVMDAAVWFGRLIGIYIGFAWGNLLGIIAAMLVGFCLALLVGKLREKVAESMKAVSRL